ncbi:minor capsid protein [Streptococcus phage Javan535]|uniref:minor capsid protein n=1 Tax=Streptococcus salivarius TaxID=1304 RepID=UPI0006893C2C|nr:minor capsid protein [Streptococcus salivarius]QBX20857.1 minor capsid protein [Streptococcus phage Javan535]QBX20915.1 minor capsid protein [Streptococcus phage Javan539]QBX30404.1 minor capsid protein [Streptococcus phage Javan534]SQB31174.1 phage protein [Streptococcus dysgalactiae]DAK35855.1 MAG TPA: Minor capsid protein [Caudoviricetes sp.]
MNNNDFSEVLKDFLAGLGLPLTPRLDYLNEGEDLVIYALPGGKVEDEDMAGTQILSLPYEIAIKSKDQQKVNATLWKINTELSKIGLELPSLNNSYTFLSLKVETPSLNDVNDQDYYIYLLDLQATIEVERSLN